MTDDAVNEALHTLTSGQSNAHHLRQKRARSQLSCIPCRNGKLKCDRRREPACDQCMKRNREGACTWAPPPNKQKKTQSVKGRVRQLEEMVVDLMNQQRGTSQNEGKDESEKRRAGEPTPPSSDENESPSRRDDIDCTKPFGQMRVSKNEISYVGETHWKAILSGIDSLRRELEDEEEVPDEEDDDNPETTSRRHDSNDVYDGWEDRSSPMSGVGFMLGTSSRMTKAQLIASVPEKRVTDRLLSRWFNSPDPFKPIVHGPTFQAEYRLFLRNPSQVPTMWLGLLFAILSLAASMPIPGCNSSSPAGKGISTQASKYHALAASAAVLADFTKPKQHTIECLLLYGAGLRSRGDFVNLWLVIGLCVRLALRMGYHRDSANYQAISPFHGEMRRRVWATLIILDVLLSFQLALPSMVKTVVADTKPPRNLLDRDFNMDTKELPPSRGIDELTPCSFTRAKLRIVNVFAEAAEQSHSTIPPSHDEMMELDRRLEEAKAQLPPLLQMPDIGELVTDPAEQLMCRFNIDLLYLKTKIVLHRRYMETPFSRLLPQEQKAGIGMSRRTAVDCAARVLQHHDAIYTASQAGGQLEGIEWFMGSISTHDFLLAAMVICLELSQQISPSSIVNRGQCPHRQAFIEVLERSQQIWESTGEERRRSHSQSQRPNSAAGTYFFDETEKAAIAMRVMLNKVRQRFPEQKFALSGGRQTDDVRASPAVATSTMPFGGIVSNHTWDNAPPADLDFSNMNVPNNCGSFGVDSGLSTLPDQLDYLGDMLDTSGSIDWTMFDAGNQNPPQEGQFLDSSDLLADLAEEPIAGNAMMGSGPGPGSEVCPEGWPSFQDMHGAYSYDVGGSDLTFDTGMPWQGDGTS